MAPKKETTTKAKKPAKDMKKTANQAEQTTGQEEQTTSQAEQTTGQEEQTTGQEEQTANQAEQTTGQEEQTADQEEQTADQAEQTENKADAQESKTGQEQRQDEFADIPNPCVYCGPSVRGVSRQYTTYQGGIPHELKVFLKEHPAARRLIVSPSKFASFRKRLETHGTAEAAVFKKVQSELR